jgi:hypothetical protein
MSESSVVGVSQETVSEWKSKYGELFMITLGDEQYVYRSMKRFEYKTIMNNPDANRAFNEEKIIQMCVVHPIFDQAKIYASKAGTVATLVELIMAASNFGANEEPVKL